MNEMGFDYFAQLDPQALALIDPQGRRWSRGELFALANRLSRALRDSGLKRGDALALMAPNCAEYLAIYLAATQVGLYLVPINWHLSQPEISYILEDSAARLLIVHGRLGGVLLSSLVANQGSVATLIAIGKVPGYREFEDFIANQPDQALEDPLPGRVMAYTSATTGRPKAICLPLPDSRAALEKTIRFHIAAGKRLGPSDIHLFASMLYHSAPLEGAVIALHMGHIAILVDRPDPQALLELIERYAVTTALVVPTLFVRLLKLPEEVRRRYRTSTLRQVLHTGAPCPVEVKQQMMEWWGPVIWDTYGAAEGAGTIASPAEWLKYPGTVGKAIPGSDIRILGDDDGPELPRGEVGTVYLTRYTGDRFEYKGDAEKTRACHRGDHFTVGDLGYMNEEGYLFICDRKVDMIISAGTNIYSAEVERVLVLHPGIADCAVFGVPDELLGESVKAVIQLAPHVEPSKELTAEIMKFLGERLSAIKLPRRVEYAAELPRDPTGKLYKRRLRDPHWALHGRSI